MVRVHRSGKEFVFLPKIKTRSKRRRRTFPSSSKDADIVISSFPHVADKISKPPPSQSRVTQGPVPVIGAPPFVYVHVKNALKLIRSLETNPNDEDRLYLKCAVAKIHKTASHYIEAGYLPPDWKFDPATATQFVWQLEPISDEEKSDSEEEPADGMKFDENVKRPEIYYVPLNKEQSELWLKFKESDKNTPTMNGLDLGRLEETAKPITVKHPFVRCIGTFAVDGFNKSFEMYVKKDIKNYLEEFEITECSYHKLATKYWFHMTVEAIEEGILGVYESKVEIATDDGRITLCRFIRIDQTPEGKGATSKTSKEDGWSNPDKYYDTAGLVRRDNRKGYNFYNPCGINRYWRLHG